MNQRKKHQAQFVIHQEKYQEEEKKLILQISEEQAIYAKRFKNGEISWYAFTEHMFGCLTQIWSVYLSHQIDRIDGFDLEPETKRKLWEETVLETVRSARISLKNKNLDGLLFIFMWKERIDKMFKSVFENYNQYHTLWENLDQRIKLIEKMAKENERLLFNIKSEQEIFKKNLSNASSQQQTKKTAKK